MNYLSQFRAANPDLQGFSDDQIVEALPQLLPERFGGKPMSQVRAEALLAPEELEARQFEQQTDGRGVLGYARDLGISALKGAISVPEMAVGLADIPTGGRVGQFLENEGGLLGFRPGEAKDILSDLHTDQYKAQQQRFAGADGVMDKTAVAIQNPSLIFNPLVESLPSIGAGGVAGRGLTAATRLGQMGLKGQVAAGAIGEGATMAGLQAEGIRQQTDDGLLTAEQSAIALGTGTLGTLFAIGGGRLAQKLGVGDIDTLVARGLKPSDVVGEIAQMPAKSIPRKVIEGAVTEGLLEELPQSVSEQILQNLALDKEWSEGVDDAAVMGTLAGMVMGGGVGAFSGSATVPRNPVGDANARINAAGDQVAAAGGDALAQESTKAQAASSEIPGAVSEAKTIADTPKAAGQVSAADLGIQMPEQRDWSQFDTAPGTESRVSLEPRQAEQPAPRQSARDMSGLDGLIITADRMGFTDEAAMLLTSQRLYRQADEARAQGDNEAASRFADRGNRLYREATETNDQVREIAHQFPVPYVSQGEVTGGEVGPYQDPGRTGETYDQPRNVGGPASLEQQRTNRLTDSGIVFGEEPDYAKAQRQQMESERAQRTADDFSARYGQEGQTPFHPTAIEGELDRSSELPPAQQRAMLPPGTGQINMGQDRPQHSVKQPQTGYGGIGRNVVERTVQAKTNALPAGNATRAITPDQYRNVMERARLALRTPVSRRTPEMTQALEVRNQVRAGEVQVTESAQPDTQSIAGEQIDQEWTRFTPESGTLNVPRAEMPQVKAENRGALVNYLNARGIDHQQAEIDPRTLKPTQAEFSPAKVQKAREFTGGDRSILVSADGHVVDGHHQWMAKRDTGEPVKVIQLQAPIDDLVPLIRDFPSSEQDSGAQTATTQQPQLKYKTNGSPFASERAAQASSAFRDNRGYASVVPVDGGFAVQIGGTNSAVSQEALIGDTQAVPEISSDPVAVEQPSFRIEPTDTSIRVMGDVREIRKQLRANGFKYPGTEIEGGLSFGRRQEGKIRPIFEAQTTELADDVPDVVLNELGDTFQNEGNQSVQAETEDGKADTNDAPRFSRTLETRSLTKSIQDQYPGVKLRLAENDSQIELALVDVPQDQREQGIGSAIMSRLVEHADKEGKALVLSPSAEFGGNKARLTEWYKRFGFVENKGKNRDYEVSETMYRPARFSRVDTELDMSYAARMQRALDQGFVQSIDELYEVKAREQGRDRIHQSGQEGERHTPDARSTGTAADRPQTFYHGTAADIERFDLGHSGRKDSGWLGEGIYLTDQPDLANHYAKIKAGGSGGNVMPVMVRLQNPYIASLSDKARLQGAAPEETQAFTKRLQELGYDGAILAFADVKEIVAFEPAQVRSTSAAFDPELASESDILLSRTDDAGLPISRDQVEVTATRITSNWTNAPEMVTVATDRDLPADLQETIDKQNARGKIDGVFHKGRFYLVADKIRTETDVERIVLHEALGHYGLRQLYGPAFGMHMDRLFNRVGGYPGIQRLGKKYGFDLSSYWENAGDMSLSERREMMADELIAHIAGTGTVQPDLIQQIAHLIRKGLRKIMAGTRFAERLDQMTDVEVLRIVAAARKAVVEGESQITVLTHDPRFVRDFETIVYGDARFSRVPDDAPVIETDGGPIAKGKTVKEMALRAREYARKHFAGKAFRNENTGDEIILPMAGVRHTLAGAQADLIKSVAVTPEIIKQGAYLGSRPEEKGNPSVLAHHYYGAKIQIDGRMHDVVVDVREMADGKRYYDHAFERKTGPESTAPSNARNPNPVEMDITTSTDSIEDDQDVRFSRTDEDGGTELPADQAPYGSIRNSVNDRVDGLRFQIQDKLIDLKRKQQEAGEVEDNVNAYQKAAIWEGRAGERLSDFDEERVQPLLDQVAQSGLSLEEVGEWLVARHAEEANSYLAEINPDKPDNERFRLAGMSNEEAQAILEKHADNKALQEVGKQVDQINKERVSMLVDEGLITQETADAWQSRYKNYVPLNREEADTADRLPSRGKGFQIKGKESKMRTGSAYWRPDKILSHVIANYESSIVRAEKNKVGEALLKFAEANPDESFWAVDTDRTTRTVRNGKVVEGAKLWDAPNELTVKRDGVEHVLVFNPNNKRAMRLVSGLKNLQAAEMNSVMQAMAKITRFLAMINTSFNPEFMISNFIRDIQTAGYNLSDTELKSMELKVIKDVFPAMGGIRNALFGDGSKEWASVWEDFRKNGGKTGWIDIHSDMKAKEKNLVNIVERIRKGKAPKHMFRRFLSGIEDMNNVIENGVRLSAYKHALDAGLSKERAAALAKDLTVNFNRKGAMGPQLNAFYMFFNAAVQGNVRLLQAMVNSKKGRALAIGTIGFAVMLDMINRSIAGDDDDGENAYDALPDYVKDRNIIVMMPGGTEPLVKMPAPWGYNTLHVAGQEIGKAISGDRFSPLDSAARVASAFADAFNPVGSGSFAQMVAPTVLDPIVQVAENKNFAGNPLMPEHTFDAFQPRPEYQMHFSTVREGSKAVAEWLNDISGGNEIRPGAVNISPEVIDLLVDTSTGGLGRMLNDSIDFTARLVTGEEIEIENVPFLRKVTGFNTDYGVKGRYYEWSTSVGYAKDEAKKLKGRDLMEARQRPEFKLIGFYTQTDKQLRALRKRRKAAEKIGASDAVIERIDEQIRQVMARFNKRYVEVVLK